MELYRPFYFLLFIQWSHVDAFLFHILHQACASLTSNSTSWCSILQNASWTPALKKCLVSCKM